MNVPNLDSSPLSERRPAAERRSNPVSRGAAAAAGGADGGSTVMEGTPGITSDESSFVTESLAPVVLVSAAAGIESTGLDWSLD
jgi:hypothetical protein